MLIKKLFFTLPFLINLCIFYLQLQSVIHNTAFILALDTTSAFTSISLFIPLLLTSISFIILCTLSYDWEIIIPTIAVSATLPIFLITFPLSGIVSIGTAISFGITYILMRRRLDNYLTFSTSAVLIPGIHLLTTLLLITASIVFYQANSNEIQRKGFHLPPALTASIESITSTFLKQQQNDVIKEYGLDPETFNNPTLQEQITIPTDLLTQQIELFLQPYTHFIPYALAGIFFFSLLSLSALATYPLMFLLWCIFFVLEKMHVVTYTIEPRDVKKLIIG